MVYSEYSSADRCFSRGTGPLDPSEPANSLLSEIYAHGGSGGISRRDFGKVALTVLGTAVATAACGPLANAAGGLETQTATPRFVDGFLGTGTAIPLTPTYPRSHTTSTPTRYPTGTPTATRTELPPSINRIVVPISLEKTGLPRFEDPGWYNKLVVKDPNGTPVEGSITIEDVPGVGAMLKYSLNESLIGYMDPKTKKGLPARINFGKRGSVTGPNYVAVDMPIMVSKGFYPQEVRYHGDRAWNALDTFWSYAPAGDYERWIKYPAILLTWDKTVGLNVQSQATSDPVTKKHAGTFNSTFRFLPDTVYNLRRIYDANGYTHVLIGKLSEPLEEIITVKDRSPGRVPLRFGHAGLYAANIGPGSVWNGDWTIFYG